MHNSTVSSEFKQESTIGQPKKYMSTNPGGLVSHLVFTHKMYFEVTFFEITLFFEVT